MRVAIVAVGTELLTGEIINGNAAWLGEQLTGAGLHVVWSAMVRDDIPAIANAISTAAAHTDAVVITGGLGPTHDDLTRDALAVAADVELHRDPDIELALAERFARNGLPFPAANLRQADVPAGATVIDNPRGSAPGLRMTVGGALVFALPGVPAEMKQMTRDAVLPDLVAAAGDVAIASVQLKVSGLAESVAAELVAPIIEAAPDVEVAILASLGALRLRATARGASQREAEARVAEVTFRMREVLGQSVYGTGRDTLAGAVLALLVAQQATVAVAESLTGGLLGAELSDVPGASAAYRGGVIAYDVAAKEALLGVDGGLLARRGPVDEDVAVAMATGVRERLGASYAIALTGVAGPDAHGGAPPGTVWCAVVGPSGARTVRWSWTGDRDRVRRLSVTYALDYLRRELMSPSGNPESKA
ncbi:MAG: competence/damage-inducible protein cinA [Frankiales bacterium]|nr:competence/damage-inducible protein cinA [Frankiales bacterium]